MVFSFACLWSGRAIEQGNVSVPRRPTNFDRSMARLSWQGPTVVAEGADRGYVFVSFSSVVSLFFLFLPLGDAPI